MQDHGDCARVKELLYACYSAVAVIENLWLGCQNANKKYTVSRKFLSVKNYSKHISLLCKFAIFMLGSTTAILCVIVVLKCACGAASMWCMTQI